MKTQWHFSIHPMGVVCLLAALLFVPIQHLVAAMIAITLHEAAHLLAIRLCRVKCCSIEWTPLGFVAQAEGFSALPAKHRVTIASAGLLASLALTIGFYPIAGQNRFGYFLFTANLAILLINALPILPLDGGRVLLALAAGAGWERLVRKTLLFLSYLSAALLTGLGLYGALNGALNPTLLLLGPYLAYAAKQSSLAAGTELVQTLENRSRYRQGEVRKIQSWAVMGEATPVSLMKIFRQCPQETFALFHTIDPENGRLLSMKTQQQIIEKLFDNK